MKSLYIAVMRGLRLKTTGYLTTWDNVHSLYPINKKLPAEDRAWALDRSGFKRLTNDMPVDIAKLSEDDKDHLYYKDEPFTTKNCISG